MGLPRKRSHLRPTKIERYPTAAAGSVIVSQGNTRVLCTASIAQDVPKWMLNDAGEATSGWVTAEYAMLPGSTADRKRRGGDSRSTEIQRLIGRSLRAAVDLDQMPGLLVTCDCDVLYADGGTRTAAITGGFVALAQAIDQACRQGLVRKNPIRGPVAAVSAGIVGGQSYLDLDYKLDVRADVDMNVVMNHRGEFIEVQGTGERSTFSPTELDTLLGLAANGIRKLIRVQRQMLRGK